MASWRLKAARIGLQLLALCLLLAIVAVTSFLAGGIVGQTMVYAQRVAQQRDEWHVYLRQHPGKFAAIRVDVSSDGVAYLSGDVSSSEDLQILKNEAKRLFGEKLGHEMMWRVNVE